MMWFARSCTIAIVLLVAPGAHARELGLITTGGDILHLRDLPPETAAVVGFHSLGYRYNVFGIYGLDFWRWGGEHVVYTSDTEVSSRDASDAASGTDAPPPWLLRLRGHADHGRRSRSFSGRGRQRRQTKHRYRSGRSPG